MYKTIVRRQIRSAFAALSRGDSAALVRQMHADVHHSFPGRHALGGERTNRADVSDWLDRLFRLFPGLAFDITTGTMAVSGPPWNTAIGVEWVNHGQLCDGSTYRNAGAHILRLRWGRVTSFHAYLHDGAESADALERLSRSGIDEATAPPIISRVPAANASC